MDQMISIINDNLKSVISGIKTHKEDTEKSLIIVKNEMDEKIAVASEYKMSVESARTIISNLETEIAELENDLNDLNAKFGAKNFKEILSAGNKEINTKIIEKRALINEQSQKILELTDKAHVLKDELVKLKEKRNVTERNLEKTTILESYYEKRITSIIEYSEEHPDELDIFIDDMPQDDLIITSDFEDVDISNVIDGSIFEEIDEISSNSEVDEDLIKEVLINSNDEDDIEEDTQREKTQEEMDLSMTQQLDDIISEANSLLQKSEEIKDKMDKHVEETVNITDDEGDEDVSMDDTIHIFVPDDEKDESIDPNLVVMPTLNGGSVVRDEEKEEDDAVESSFLEELMNIDAIEEEDDILNLKLDEEEETDEDNGVIDLKIEENEPEFETETIIPEENELHLLTEQENMDMSNLDFLDSVHQCNLDETKFKEEDLEKLKKSFNMNNTKDFINVMRKHNIAVAKIYDAPEVLMEVTPQNLDQMLTLMEKTGATSDDMSYIYDKLNKVNINKLEESVSVNVEGNLGEVLYEAIPYDGESNFAANLGLSMEEENELRKSATVDQFKIMNLFPEIVTQNYNTLKNFEIKNLNECFTKHPTRFLLNPSRFMEILDKYDTEDLVRCINKNSAVIDKL